MLQFIRTSLPKISQLPATEYTGSRVRSTVLVRNWLPSGWIKRECGRALWKNSVAVGVYFPSMDKPHNPIGHCNDCARMTFLAAMTTGGWTIWGRY